jgi:hypothetical protein
LIQHFLLFLRPLTPLRPCSLHLSILTYRLTHTNTRTHTHSPPPSHTQTHTQAMDRNHQGVISFREMQESLEIAQVSSPSILYGSDIMYYILLFFILFLAITMCFDLLSYSSLSFLLDSTPFLLLLSSIKLHHTTLLPYSCLALHLLSLPIASIRYTSLFFELGR